MTDDAHAHRAVLEGNQPAPAIVQPCGGNIAFVHAGEPCDTFKVPEHCGTAVFPAPLLAAQLSRQKGIAAAGIDDEARFPCAGRSSPVLGVHQRGVTGTKLNPERLRALVETDAVGDGVLGENLIEFGPFHLEGVRLGFIECLRKVEHLGAAVAEGHQLGAVFEDADLFDLRKHAQPPQHRNGLREQRFSDVEPRVRILFQHVHGPALTRKKGGNRRAAGASSNDENIASRAGGLVLKVLSHSDGRRGKGQRSIPKRTGVG